MGSPRVAVPLVSLPPLALSVLSVVHRATAPGADLRCFLPLQEREGLDGNSRSVAHVSSTSDARKVLLPASIQSASPPSSSVCLPRGVCVCPIDVNPFIWFTSVAVKPRTSFVLSSLTPHTYCVYRGRIQ